MGVVTLREDEEIMICSDHYFFGFLPQYKNLPVQVNWRLFVSYAREMSTSQRPSQTGWVQFVLVCYYANAHHGLNTYI